jgi:hypothetical protein
VSISYPKNVKDLNLSNNLTNENEDVEESLGLDTDLEDIISKSIFDNHEIFETSYISKPYFAFDMGEPRSTNSEFVYNYFQKTERSNIVNKADLTFSKEDLNNSSDLLFQNKSDRLPRYIKITITGPTGVEYSTPSADVTNLGDIDSIKAAINVEASNSTPFYTGFELFDVDIEKAAYENLLNNLFLNPDMDFLNQNENSAAASLLSETLEDETIYNTSCKDIIKQMMNIKNSGYSIANKDVKPENINIFSRNKLFSGLNISIKSANLFFGDIYNRASRLSNSIFASENRGIKIVANNKTNNLLSNFSDQIGTEILAAEFDLNVQSIASLTEATTSSQSQYSIKHIGYYILKEETTDSGIPIKYDPICKLTDKSSFTIIDPEVRYGGFYTYIVRSLYEVIAPAYDPEDGETYNYEKFLLASEGIPSTITCNETSVPPPPCAIRGNIDFKYRVPRVTWQFPVNKQRDVKRFQVFKRESVSLPFTLVAEYNFDDSVDPVTTTEIAQSKNLYKRKFPKVSYTDYKYVDNSSPIYAIASVDAHGLTSNLSTQISVKYNKMSNTPEVKLISREGAPKPYPNIFIESDTFLDAINISNMDRMTLFFDPEHFVVKKTINHNDENQNNEIDLNLISANPNKSTYKIQIVNLDMLKSKEINIKVIDKHNNNLESSQSITTLNEENLKFT